MKDAPKGANLKAHRSPQVYITTTKGANMNTYQLRQRAEHVKRILARHGIDITFTITASGIHYEAAPIRNRHERVQSLRDQIDLAEQIRRAEKGLRKR